MASIPLLLVLLAVISSQAKPAAAVSGGFVSGTVTRTFSSGVAHERSNMAERKITALMEREKTIFIEKTSFLQ
jgi:hypothetical protein